MTLETKRAQARQWLAYRRSLRHLGEQWLLYAPSQRLTLKPKQRLILWQTEPGNDQRQLLDARSAKSDTRTLRCLSA